MRLFIPVVFASLLAASCGSSRYATDSAPQNNNNSNVDASTNAGAATNNTPQEASEKAPSLNDKDRVYRTDVPENSSTLPITETK